MTTEPDVPKWCTEMPEGADSDACAIGYADWTLRKRCGVMAACEVRIIKNGHAYAWRPACYQHADALFAVIAKSDRSVWDVEMQPDTVLREVLGYRAEVVTLAVWKDAHPGTDGELVKAQASAFAGKDGTEVSNEHEGRT